MDSIINNNKLMGEKAYNWIQDITQSLLSLLKVLIRSKFVYLNHSIDSSDLYILASGPSLKHVLTQHTEFLKTKDTLTVNGFSSSDFFEIIKPKYYVFAAPELWSESTTDAKKHIREAMINDLIKKTTWPLLLFLPVGSLSNKSFLRRFEVNQHIKISFFNTTPVEGNKLLSYTMFRKGLGMPRPHNVLIPCLMIGIRNSVQRIHLFGVDHSWLPLLHVTDQNIALLKQEHFYDKDTAKAQVMNMLGKERRMLHQILEKFYLSFKAYVEIQEYAQTQDCSIYNYTKGSFIDAFERKSIDDNLTVPDQKQ